MAKKTFFSQKSFQMKLYAGLTAILLIVMGYYTFTNLTKMLDVQAKTRNNLDLMASLDATNERLDTELNTLREENEELDQNINIELEFVFPDMENHTVLTRTLEQLESEYNRKLSPFIINSLQYLKVDESDDGTYAVLPFKMTIHSSYDNFFKFLRYVENSGTLRDKTRLLNMKSIVINFVSPTGSPTNLSGENEINFNVSMEAYFKKTE